MGEFKETYQQGYNAGKALVNKRGMLKKLLYVATVENVDYESIRLSILKCVLMHKCLLHYFLRN